MTITTICHWLKFITHTHRLLANNLKNTWLLYKVWSKSIKTKSLIFLNFLIQNFNQDISTVEKFQRMSQHLVCWQYHHHHHVVLVAQISLCYTILYYTIYNIMFNCHFSLSFITSGRSSGLHPVSSHSCRMYVCAGCPAFARSCVGVHESTSLMSSSLFFQQCPACLVHLTWIVFMIGGRWPYSWCLVGCCRQDL